MGTFYIPIFFQVKGFSTTAAGMRLIPQSIGGSIGSLSAGLIMNYSGKYRVLGLSCIGIFILGVALLNTLTFDTLKARHSYISSVLARDMVHADRHAPRCYLFGVPRPPSSGNFRNLCFPVYRVNHRSHDCFGSLQNLLLSSLHQRFDGFEGADDEIRRIRDSLEELQRLPAGWKEGVYESYSIALRGVFATV